MWKKLSVSLVILVLVLAQASAAWSTWFTNEPNNEESLKSEIVLKEQENQSQKLLIEELQILLKEQEKDLMTALEKSKSSATTIEKLSSSLTEAKSELGKLRALSNVSSLILTEEPKVEKTTSFFMTSGVEWTPIVNNFAVNLGFGIKKNSLGFSVGAKLTPDWGNLLDFAKYVPTAYNAAVSYYF